jgi:hypothetical protein
MTKAAAIYQFWSGFGLTAYEENNIPSDAELPYISYQYVSNKFERETPMSASIWYRDSSEVAMNAKAEEIGAFIDNMPKAKKIDGGRLRIYCGSPWCNTISDQNDPSIKAKILNIVVEYMVTH